MWLQMPCQDDISESDDEDDEEVFQAFFKKFKAEQAIRSVVAQVLMSVLLLHVPEEEEGGIASATRAGQSHEPVHDRRTLCDLMVFLLAALQGKESKGGH